MHYVLCGVTDGCSGTRVGLPKGLGLKNELAHQSHEEAFKCKVQSLKRLGLERIGPREFRTERGILLLPKRSRFGAALRPGKAADKGGKRFNVIGAGGGTIV